MGKNHVTQIQGKLRLWADLVKETTECSRRAAVSMSWETVASSAAARRQTTTLASTAVRRETAAAKMGRERRVATKSNWRSASASAQRDLESPASVAARPRVGGGDWVLQLCGRGARGRQVGLPLAEHDAVSMWKLVVGQGNNDPWLCSPKDFLGREIWEFHPDAEIERLRREYTRNRFTHRESSDLLLRMQARIEAEQEGEMISWKETMNPGSSGGFSHGSSLPYGTTHNNILIEDE
ncbi:hypothetical protein EJB05_49769, partial [Eragrostis curvula]